MATPNGSAQTQQQSLEVRTTTLPANLVHVPLVPSTLSEAFQVANWLAKSDILPDNYRGKPENVLAALYMGNDLGLSPMQAMREIYVVHGIPRTSALLKVSLVRQSPLCEHWRIIESTADHCVIETKRRGDAAPFRHEYTLKDAELAGLYPGKGDSNWAKRPKLMLRRRCESEICDEIYPDVVKGLRSEDEAQEIQGEVMSRVVSAPPPPAAVAPTPPSAPSKPEPQVVMGEVVEQQSAPAAQATQPTTGAPDPVEVIIAELASADQMSQADFDALVQRARETPKDHPLRKQLGEAVNAAKNRRQGAR